MLLKEYGTRPNFVQINDFKETTFIKAMFILSEDQHQIFHKCPFLIFEKNMCYTVNYSESIKINYKDIAHVELSLCTRLFNSSKLYHKKKMFAPKKTQFEEPIYVGRNNLTYCLDLTFNMKDNKIYRFESFSLVNTPKILESLELVTKSDPMGIVNFIGLYENPSERIYELANRFGMLAKKYKLDNPRGTCIVE